MPGKNPPSMTPSTNRHTMSPANPRTKHIEKQTKPHDVQILEIQKLGDVRLINKLLGVSAST